MVCIVLNGMYICCNVLDYSIDSYDARDVYIVSKDRKMTTILIKTCGCVKAYLCLIFNHSVTPYVCLKEYILLTDWYHYIEKDKSYICSMKHTVGLCCEANESRSQKHHFHNHKRSTLFTDQIPFLCSN